MSEHTRLSQHALWMHLNENELQERIRDLRSRRALYSEFSIHRPKRKNKVKTKKEFKLDGEVLSGEGVIKEKRKRTRKINTIVPKTQEELDKFLDYIGVKRDG